MLVALKMVRHVIPVAVLAVLAVIITSGALVSRRELDTPCPQSQHTEQPLSVHLVPDVVEHGSWLLVRTTGLTPGTVLLACTDGVVLGVDPLDEGDIQAGTERLRVATRWVNWMWLTGRLDDYRDSDRWLIIYPAGGAP